MMRCLRGFIPAAILLATLAGCPVLQTSEQGTTPASGGSSGTSSTGGTRGSQTTTGNDDLTSRFPDCQEPTSAAEWQSRILELVNQERAQQGLPTLQRDAVLESQAEQYACEMIQYDFFDHVNPVTQTTLADRAGEFGYDYLVIGENLAAGQSTPEEAFESWMNSPGHRQNILDPRFTELGVGVRSGGAYGTYWVQEFGQPLP